jgi:Cu+-exporting ATPase
VSTATCDLCSLPYRGRPIEIQSGGTLRRFCCEGCARVWRVAEEAGLIDELAGATDPKRAAAGSRAARSDATGGGPAGVRLVEMGIGGMWCAGCGAFIERALESRPGVARADASYAAGKIRVAFDPRRIELGEIEAFLAELGYRVTSSGRARPRAEAELEDHFLRLVGAIAFSMWVMWLYLMVLYPAYDAGRGGAEVRGTEIAVWLLATPVQLYSAWPFLVGAWRAARVQAATMDTLVAIGTWAAYLYSVWRLAVGGGALYFDTSAMLVTVILLGRTIELWARARARRVVSLAGDTLPEEALVLRGADELSVPVAEVVPGDLLVARAGDRLVADGVVTQGVSRVDQSIVTGESEPLSVTSGDEVLAGAVNAGPAFTYQARRVGEARTAARIARAVSDAQFGGSNVQRLADQAAAVFAPVVLAIAALTAVGWWVVTGRIDIGLARAVTVLVVACPCAFGLATPLAVASLVGAAARAGAVFKTAEAVERAGEVDIVYLDKTGTLTEGRPEVVAVEPADGWTSDGLLDLAARAERWATHPVGRAIARSALGRDETVRGDEDSPEAAVEPGEERAGAGVRARVDGRDVVVGSARFLREAGADAPDGSGGPPDTRAAAFVAVDGRYAGRIAVSDPVRPEALETVRSLEALGLEVRMLTGDRDEVARAVAGQAGISKVEADLLPQEKTEAIAREAGAGHTIAMVGDGINDGPALAAADVAVAIGRGSGLALEAADVALVQDGLHALAPTLRLARRGSAVIRENLLWALLYNGAAVPAAVLGFLTPVIAALAMATSSVAVTLNSLRLARSGAAPDAARSAVGTLDP